jgi:hypothetical protein
MYRLNLDFESSLNYILGKVESGEPVAVSRFGDGECLLMTEGRVHGQALKVDGWAHPGGQSLLGKALNEVAENDQLIQGISCRCHQPKFHDVLVEKCKGVTTFACVFINGNYTEFCRSLHKIQKPIFLIASKKTIFPISWPASISGLYLVPGDCVNVFESDFERLRRDMKLIASTWKDSLILLSAGPLATVFVHWLWQFNPAIQALDVGSALDPYLFRKETRRYHNATHRDRSAKCKK